MSYYPRNYSSIFCVFLDSIDYTVVMGSSDDIWSRKYIINFPMLFNACKK